MDKASSPLVAMAKELIAPIPLEIIRREKRRFHLDFKHVMCVSQAIKNDLAEYAGIDERRLRVVYNGVEEGKFIPNWDKKPYGQERTFSLLYAGNVAPHKGVHTAIEAMGLLAQKHGSMNVNFSILGSGHPDYEGSLRDLVTKYHLEDKVNFLGRFPRAEMPGLLQRFDALVFPSIWEEPLARVMQEAMAAGLTVIGTLTGGTGELLVEGETGLTFEPENAGMLAQCIEQLYNDPALCRKLADNGRNRVISDFGMRRMIDEIETYLENVIKNTIALHE
jgi:glycosyltransferase involved in cell wall biosynthesis